MADIRKIKLASKIITYIACGLLIVAGVLRFFLLNFDVIGKIISVYLM